MNLDTDLSCLLQNIIMKAILSQDDQQYFILLSLPFVLLRANVISSSVSPSVMTTATNKKENFLTLILWKSKTRVTSYEFKSTSYEFKFTSYEFKSTSYVFKSTSYEFKLTSYEFKSTSYELKFTSYEFKFTS